ncbi:protein Jade-1 [Electrophorus electricus]|uniref:Protein Jade-1 n=1 Tax=Electrophorus electricus TaxID=8005 RepID=A0A4W4GGL5_ELEEL|nr:protein Jade-1 [Electrophorus electricus]XP_026888370.2 protein Jade-1 [Electrophorus electricus]
MKRSRAPSTSEESDNGSNCTSWSQVSNSRRRDGQRPSEVFRTDLITAMKLHDSYQLNSEDYYVLSDPWRQEWEKGVQVPVSPHSIPKPTVRVVAEKSLEILFTRPKKLLRSWGAETSVLGYVPVAALSEGTCRYDLNEEDVSWLEVANREFSVMGMPLLEEDTMERVMEEFEHNCYDNMSHAIETEEGLGIEYDEDVVCDVCQSPDGEDGNEMVFCDKCNICVHQACYGILKVPEGSWLCRTCALGISPKCQLCPKKGGAMKPTRSGSKWVHVSCALWIPEVSIGNPEKMEPITSVSQIPNNRWALICCLCKEKTGACIQCSAKSCRVAFHVTCGLQHGLKMNTILTEDDEVKFKSFCPTHSGLHWPEGVSEDSRVPRDQGGTGRGTAFPADPRTRHCPDGARLSERKLRVQQLEDEFYRFVAVDDVAEHLGLPPETVDFLFQYWKLKRRAAFNQPLITPKREEEESLARREQEVLLRRLRLFTHLRQDLERVRNLTYMVTRREKIKRSVCRVQEQIFHHHVRLLEQGHLPGASSTRQLEEAMFYFRGVPSTSTSPQPLRGHAAQNSASELSQRRSVLRCRASKRVQGQEDEPTKVPSTEPLFLSKMSSPEGVPDTACGGAGRGHSNDAMAVCPGEIAGKEMERPLEEQRRRRRRRRIWEQLPARGKHKLGSKVTAEPVQKYADPKSVSDGAAVSRTKSSAVMFRPRYNGSLRRVHPSQYQVKMGSDGTSARHIKNWGSFRIPKRSDRTPGGGEDELDDRSFPHSHPARALDASPAPTSPPVRTRLRTGVENRALTPETDPSQSEQKKRCHAQRLRSHDPMTQRYGSEVLRRGVLAS